MSSTEDNVVNQGHVKWFNNKAGYGFISFNNKDNTLDDIFVHHSAISVKSEQYRYLVEGEYVEFTISEKTENDDKYKQQVSKVNGINGGNLLCETRTDSRTKHKSKKNKSKTY